MSAKLLCAEENGCFLIYRVKMQNATHSFLFLGKLFRGKRKFPVVPQVLRGFQPSVNSGKQGFRRKRHPDGTLSGKIRRIFRRTTPICGHKIIFPETVQHMVIRSFHLRTGIFRQDIVIGTGSHQRFPPESIEGMQDVFRVRLIQIRSSIF